MQWTASAGAILSLGSRFGAGSATDRQYVMSRGHGVRAGKGARVTTQPIAAEPRSGNYARVDARDADDVRPLLVRTAAQVML